MPRRLPALLALLAGATALMAVATVYAQPPGGVPGQPPGPFGQPGFPGGFGPPMAAPVKRERAVYAVKGGDPAALAELVGKHFRNEVEASAAAGAVVLSGPAAAVAEATTLLGQVDRRPRSVELEVTLVEATGKDADLPAGEVDAAKLAELTTAGATARRIRLTAAEGQTVSAQSGADKPYLSTSSFIGPAGPQPKGGAFGKKDAADPDAPPPARPRAVQQSINYRPTGTTVKATSRVGADGAVAVELSVQDSTTKPAAAGDEVGSPAFETASLSTRLTVPAGKAVVAHATRHDAGDRRAVTLVVVTAKVDGAAK